MHTGMIRSHTHKIKKEIGQGLQILIVRKISWGLRPLKWTLDNKV